MSVQTDENGPSASFRAPAGLIRIRVRVRAHSEFTVTFY
jgi:hypothetical protein